MTEENKDKQPESPKKRRAAKKAPQKPAKPKESWVHVDYYLMTLNERDEVKQGFKIYMKSQAYQTSYEAFDEHFKEFKKRKITGGAQL